MAPRPSTRTTFIEYQAQGSGLKAYGLNLPHVCGTLEREHENQDLSLKP
jgi:hypothetical protein